MTTTKCSPPDGLFLHGQFCSTQCYLIVLKPQTQNWSQSSQTLFYQPNLCNVLNPSLSLQQSSWHLQGFHLKELISPCSSVRSNSSPIRALSRGAATQSHLQAPLLSRSRAYFYHLCNYFPHWSLELLKIIRGGGINFFPTPADAGIVTSSHQSWMLLMASKNVESFPEGFQFYFAQIH